MPFSPKIKDEARWRSGYRCCVCHDVFVEVHHLVPEADGGPSTIENAAPLCAKHHDLFGGNPEKRTMLRAMRDAWWAEIAEIRAARTDFFEQDPRFSILVNSDPEGVLLSRPLLIYHLVREIDDFPTAAQALLRLLQGAQKDHPNRRRVLWVDICGHEGKQIEGSTRHLRWDQDMMELQFSFARTVLAQFFWKIHFPLLIIENEKAQNNKVPDILEILHPKKSHDELIEYATNKGIRELYVGGTDAVIRLKRTSNFANVTESASRKLARQTLHRRKRK